MYKNVLTVIKKIIFSLPGFNFAFEKPVVMNYWLINYPETAHIC